MSEIEEYYKGNIHVDFEEDEFFKDKIDTSQFEDDIYNQFSKDMARCVDIDFAKTPIVDIFTGYSRYKVLQDRIDKALKMIWDNYGLLDKYQVEMLEDILKGEDK